ncbi:Fc.00g082330.m01.CDS01 [Cosmosporella sp. VM-42]
MAPQLDAAQHILDESMLRQDFDPKIIHLPMMVATVVPSSFFLPLESVRLGRLIKNINHPHEGYHEPPTGDVPKAIMTPFSFSSLNQQNSKTQFGSALTSLISAGFSKRLQSQIHLAPARGNNYRLDNSDAWFDKAVSLPDTRKWIEKAALRGHKIYIIVGIQTSIDTRIVQRSAREQQARGQVTVPASLSLTAAAAVMPFAELVDPAIHGEHQNAESDQRWLLAPGEQVCSLQYREVKTRWLSSRLIEPPQLSKTRQWSCMEGDKRDTYEDSSDEEDEDMIEVDLGNVEELNGGGMQRILWTELSTSNQS